MTTLPKDQKPKPLTGLTLGPGVCYVRPEDGAHRAAVVVDVGDGTGKDVELLVFGLPNESLFYVRSCAYDAEKATGTWHWTERG